MLFRNDIQGLRALAFIFVFIFHLNPSWLPGGFIGEDIFFVISGYLITSIILHQKSSDKFSFISFYQVIAGFFIYLQFDLSILRRSLITAIAYTSNIYFGGGDNYFGAKLAENPLLHTWSLAIEMQFYIILPAILRFFGNKKLPYIIGGLLVGITAYIQFKLTIEGYSSVLYFSFLSRVPEFLVGVFFGSCLKNGKLSVGGIFTATSGLLMIGYSLVFINENTLFPGLYALVPIIGVVLILISSDNNISKIQESKLLVYLGGLSYSLYLWHWPIMAYLRYRNGVYEGYEFSAKVMIYITILTFCLAWLSYTFVEHVYRKQTNKRFVLMLSPIVLPLIFLTSVMVKWTKYCSLRGTILLWDFS